MGVSYSKVFDRKAYANRIRDLILFRVIVFQ